MSMNTIDYRDTTRVKPATCMSMHVNAYTRVIFVCIKRVSHTFSVELVAGLYRTCIINYAVVTIDTYVHT